MIHIRIKAAYVASNPAIAANPAAFILHLGDDDYPVPSISRDLSNIDEAVRNGSPTQINLRPGHVFEIEDEIFETLVKSAEGGGDTNLISRLVYFINRGVVEVLQDGSGTPLTAKQVIKYSK